MTIMGKRCFRLIAVVTVLIVGWPMGCQTGGGRFADWDSPAALAVRERLERNPDDSQAWYWRGYAASHLRDVKTVVESYTAAIRLDPKNEWYRISYGWALFNAGDFVRAKKQWLDAYEFCEGKHRESNITVALGYYGVGDFENAALFFDSQVKLDSRFGGIDGLQKATGRWTWREKQAVYHLFDIWRYSYRP